MPTPITPERAARRADITRLLREQGPLTTRQLYDQLPEFPDLTEVARIVHELRKAGELVSEGEEKKPKWHRLANGADQDMIGETSVSADEPPALAPEPAETQEPPDSAWIEVLEEVDETDETDGFEISYWLGSRGELRIVSGCVEIILPAPQFAALREFLRRIEPLLGDPR